MSSITSNLFDGIFLLKNDISLCSTSYVYIFANLSIVPVFSLHIYLLSLALGLLSLHFFNILTFGVLAFGDLAFGDLAFGDLDLGDLAFGDYKHVICLLLLDYFHRIFYYSLILSVIFSINFYM